MEVIKKDNVIAPCKFIKNVHQHPKEFNYPLLFFYQNEEQKGQEISLEEMQESYLDVIEMYQFSADEKFDDHAVAIIKTLVKEAYEAGFRKYRTEKDIFI